MPHAVRDGYFVRNIPLLVSLPLNVITMTPMSRESSEGVIAQSEDP